jgi:hypothetical protein
MLKDKGCKKVGVAQIMRGIRRIVPSSRMVHKDNTVAAYSAVIVASLREYSLSISSTFLNFYLRRDRMTDSLSPMESSQTKPSFASPSQPLVREDLDFRPMTPIGTPLQINVGDMIVVKADSTADQTTAGTRHRVVGRSPEGDLIIVEDATRKCGNGYEFKYILNLSGLREITIKQKPYLTDGQDVLQHVSGLHNFRCCPELRVLSSTDVSLA